MLDGDLEKILISADAIEQRVGELADEIAADYRDLQGDEEMVLVPVLTGSIIFVADLMRQLPLKMRFNVVTVSSYPGQSTTSQGPVLEGTLPENLEGRHVLMVDDILDSGQTLRLLRREIEQRQPASLKTCVLLRKQIASALDTSCDYVGFDIANEFVVGYGLDFDDYYRNLPHIGVLRSG